MNEVQEALYLALLENGKLDTPDTEKALYLALDYIENITGMPESSKEMEGAFDVLVELESETRRTAFEVGLRAGLKLAE